MSAEMELKQLTLSELAPSTQLVAACIYGPSVYSRPGTFRGQDVLAVCEDYPNGLRASLGRTGGEEVRFLLVDRNLLESDIKKGALGDFLTEKLLYPYVAFANPTYLANVELEAKRRVIREEAKDLVVQYGELCRGLVAKPAFFGLSRMRRRGRSFIPSMGEYVRFMDPPVRDQNLSSLTSSYEKAVTSLTDDLVEYDGENVTLSDNTIDRWQKARASGQVVNILQESRRAFYSYLTKGRTVFFNLDLLSRELSTPVRIDLRWEVAGPQPEDPKNHLFVRTAEGLASLNERASMEEILSGLRRERPITISPLAGVLNEVFLVTLGKESFVAKKFTDWHGFKWFTLNLVAFGSKFFAVSGKARMGREYGINRYLAKKGVHVPKIIQINLPQRILIEEYVSGTPVNRLVNRIVNGDGLADHERRLAKSLGETLASIHRVGVTVGDSKPENFVASENGIYAVDLEQAEKRGDYAWDVAELLYYTGHYSGSPKASKGLKEFVHEFVEGYSARGHASELRKAAGVRYVKPFSVWTPPPVMLEISKRLREAT